MNDHIKALMTAALAAFAPACGGEDSGLTPYYDGTESAALGAAGNQARCSTCHSAVADSGGGSGSTFYNLAYHTTFKGGGADLLGAVNACVTGWMGGTALTASDPAFLELKAFMESISDPAVTTPNPLMPEVLADEAAYEAAYSGGDASLGQSGWSKYCGRCHDVALQLSQFPTPPRASVAARPIGYIAQHVRTSGPPPSSAGATTDATPGPMPFFEPRDLSAAELANIIAFLKQ